MKEIYSGIYRVELSLDSRGESQLKTHIIKQEGRSAIVDPGLGGLSDAKLIWGALEELNIEPQDLDVLVTHNHIDHTALASELVRRGATAYMHPWEAILEENFSIVYIKPSQLWEDTAKYLGICEPTSHIKMEEYRETALNYGAGILPYTKFEHKPIRAGRVFEYGAYKFEVIELPGHTRGQVGFLDREHKLFFCGDQLMTDIVPVVMTTKMGSGMLEQYIKSLHIIATEYKDYTCYSSHGAPFDDLDKHVARITKSYMSRCDRALKTLKKRGQALTTVQMCEAMFRLPLEAGNVVQFLNYTMAINKTLSCLEYLEGRSKIKRHVCGDVAYWSAL